MVPSMWLQSIQFVTIYGHLPHRIHGTGIFTYIYHKNQPNAGTYIYIYIPYMVPMGTSYMRDLGILVWVGSCAVLVFGRSSREHL